MNLKNKKNEHKIRNDIDMNNLPKHIAIIMDGNGRWAKKRFMHRSAGHKAGVETVKEIVKAAGDIGIEYLTLYAFSTENWYRPKEEVDFLMKLLVDYLRKELNVLHENNVRINVIGNLDKLPEIPRQEVYKAIEKTKGNTKLKLNIALNYGGRSEIITAVKECINDVKNNIIDIHSIDEELFKKYLYTKDQPDPDLLIRPGGEYRVSNFLLYQMAYTEFWFSDIYWPDFKREDFFKAILDYQKRERRFGGI
ncbi:isoprenyl transferase [Caldisalinibacter kiritimatiensis]|uniref:Isoprenyl transferase n=1 Tax=Caldisalinibacter kiritimatiensis TaxID=1304284 RepID=R1CPL7_9FIRM|nr:isoprenyl transferase [Caldisalinibacter kiritimatiensis]EOD00611.1 Undecaprenyl pyrophosphate synthetase [Caldisalinibacter kiritimatiensis]